MNSTQNFRQKTTVFNLIILDESGSMHPTIEATISGCNETIQTAKLLQRENADIQNSFMSIYAFQSGSTPSRYICKNNAVLETKEITHTDYRPGGLTPLLDAVGSTLSDLQAVASTHENAMGIVTIITDGYENSSREYSYSMVKELIANLKEKGWTFNFIGANIDAATEAAKLNIDNHRQFESTAEGTKEMYDSYKTRMRDWNRARIDAEARAYSQAAPAKREEEVMKVRRSYAKKFFSK